MSKRRTKLEFPSNNVTLAGLLEAPNNGIQAYALFAHCFTCGKDIAAASRIARTLVAQGYGVLRFDFTGLGNSDGDFSNTNFSSNVQDLVAAADYLREQYQAPRLLIGHSLGGTAVLKAAHEIPECVGVVTIGAPADASHVAKHFGCDLEAIQRDGVAPVNLAGRTFTIKKQFLDDIAQQPIDHLGHLRRALLVFHSPVDTIVSIQEAEKIYGAARHPKSFISLDTADHLLTKNADAEYVATCISAWASKFLPEYHASPTAQTEIAQGHVMVQERDHRFTLNVMTDSHMWLADEPVSSGGNNLGPDPYEHLLAALGACTSMTLRMYAKRKNIPLENVTVELSHHRQYDRDCQTCDTQHAYIEVIERTITLSGDLTQEQRQRLLEIADKCPVHRTLQNNVVIHTSAVA